MFACNIIAENFRFVPLGLDLTRLRIAPAAEIPRPKYEEVKDTEDFKRALERGEIKL